MIYPASGTYIYIIFKDGEERKGFFSEANTVGFLYQQETPRYHVFVTWDIVASISWKPRP